MVSPRNALRPARRAAGVLWSLMALAGCGDDDPGSEAAVGGSAGVAQATGGAGGASGGAAGSASSSSAGGGAVQPVTDAGARLPPGSCTPGETRECTFDQLCTGVQSCGSDGTFGSCECSTAALVGGGIVGARCQADTDCAPGATCLRADSDMYLGAGGPAGGYCSFPCTVSAEDPSEDDCDERDPQSFCAPLGPGGATYCIRTCLSLDPEPGEAKCLNRPELVCVSEAAATGNFTGMRQLGYCAPQCGSDEDCPAGRVCHAQAGICTRGQVDAAPIGARCTLDNDCAGQACEARDEDNVGTCTASCVLGSLSGCGYGHDESPRGAACLTPRVAASRFSEGVGDLGLCRELCSVAEDCERFGEGWTCEPLNPGAQEFFGQPGACVPG